MSVAFMLSTAVGLVRAYPWKRLVRDTAPCPAAARAATLVLLLPGRG